MLSAARPLAIAAAPLYGSAMNKILVLALALSASCGPSSAELKTARDTTYQAPPATLFAAAKAATQAAHYDIKLEDPDNMKLVTDPKWYTPEGQPDASVGNNISQYQQDSINLGFVVELPKSGADSYKLSITRVVLRKHGLSSNPETMDPEDPAVPPWVAGKASALELGIHDALKPYAVGGTSTSGTMPAPAPAAPTPAPAPAAEPAPAP
jgi:hypothetical protein